MIIINTRNRAILTFLIIMLYTLFQTVVVIFHEYAHSSAAWVLGYTRSPFTVIWGNPITMQGWDEGVPYDRLFPSGGHLAEAVIGGIPLFLHAAFVAVSLYLLLHPPQNNQSLRFFGLYIFAVINLAELIAYIVMRPFIPTGDTGRFNEGTGLPPWLLFVCGMAFLSRSLWILARRVTPMVDSFTDGSRLVHRTIVGVTAFIMFLWGSGLRIILLYPDPQWIVGLVGVAAFVAWVMADFYQPVRQLELDAVPPS